MARSDAFEAGSALWALSATTSETLFACRSYPHSSTWLPLVATKFSRIVDIVQNAMGLKIATFFAFIRNDIPTRRFIRKTPGSDGRGSI